jgi:transposase
MDSVVEDRIMSMLPFLDERQRRVYLAAEVQGLGRGGLKKVHELTGVSKTTIIKGSKELSGGGAEPGRVRRSGGGRKAATEKHTGIEAEIEAMLDGGTAGSPERVLLWTTKSLRNIAGALKEKGYDISHDTVGNILRSMGYSLQQNQKMLQLGEPHPDRGAQFEHISGKCAEFIAVGLPVISVDTKKKELVGNFKNGGAEWRPGKSPVKVLDHDFPIAELGKVAPYGVYDISRNEGFVNLGLSHDTAEFAVASIMRWWLTIGANAYPKASAIYINCDSGGSNGSRVRLWKLQLQEFADMTGLDVHVSHFPPGTSKWNKIEHRMFCYISKNWRGRPLVSVEAVVELISSTTTSKGLTISCLPDDREFVLGTKVTDEEMAAMNMVPDAFQGCWNYTICPR